MSEQKPLTKEEKRSKCLMYAANKTAIKKLEEENDKLGLEVLAIVCEEAPKDFTVKTDWGIFMVVPKKKWTYPKPIIAMEKELKELKVEAEAKGEATYTENHYLLFKVKKDEQEGIEKA